MTRARSSGLTSKPARDARQMPKMSDEAPAAHKRDVRDDSSLPVRVYESDGRIMVAAPMPGLEPRDISVSVNGDHITIHGALRGPHQDERDLSVAEWAIGPYHRDLTLGRAVDGSRANATYGNGVLVLALPKAERGERGRAAQFTLDVLTATRGTHVGHAGRDLHRTTAAAQQSMQRDVAAQARTSRPVAATKAKPRLEESASAGRKQRKPKAGPVNV